MKITVTSVGDHKKASSQTALTRISSKLNIAMTNYTQAHQSEQDSQRLETTSKQKAGSHLRQDFINANVCVCNHSHLLQRCYETAAHAR